MKIYMKKYNIYYKGGIVNSSPIPENTLSDIKKNGSFLKVDKYRSTKETIPIDNCRIVECISL